MASKPTDKERLDFLQDIEEKRMARPLHWYRYRTYFRCCGSGECIHIKDQLTLRAAIDAAILEENNGKT